MELRELHYIQLRLVQSYTVFCIMASEGQFQATISLNVRAMNLNSVQMKGKILPVHAVKAYRWSRGTAPLILNLGTRWR
jgi:hypothetical protein